jgi:hypothetical protein
MGASVSSSVTEIVATTMVEFQSTVISEAFTTGNQSIVIEVTDTTGDVNISGNTIQQTGSINTQASLSALNESQISQQMTQQIQQEIKSEISGINFFNVSSTSSVMNLCMTAAVQVMATTTMTCATNSNQNMTIQVEGTEGNVNITDNSFKQVSRITSDCVQNAAQRNSSMQAIDSAVDNSVSSSTEGFSMIALVLLIVAIAMFPAMLTKSAGKSVMNIIFPMCLGFGVFYTIKWMTQTTTIVNSHAFSKLVGEVGGPCSGAKVHSNNTTFRTPVEAEEFARNTGGVEAYDFKAMTLNEQGMPTYMPTYTSTFYKSVGGDCEKYIIDNPDSLQTVSKPIMASATGPPNNLVGEAYLNMLTSEYYFFLDRAWILQGSFLKAPPIVISWGSADPTLTNMEGQVGNHYVMYNADFPSEFLLYKKESNGWVDTLERFVGPGPKMNCPDPQNASGFVKQTRSFALFITGVSLILVGAIGMNRAHKKKKKNKKKK